MNLVGGAANREACEAKVRQADLAGVPTFFRPRDSPCAPVELDSHFDTLHFSVFRESLGTSRQWAAASW